MKNKKISVDHYWPTLRNKIVNDLNYFLSGWIENFGVVPLFLLAAFLFLPIFLTLFSLLICVTRVLETIFQPLTLTIQLKRTDYLSLKMLIVKGLLVTSTYAAEHPIRLAKGEILELTVRNLEEYTVGNSEIISTRYNPKSKKLLLKALKIGHTEIMVWEKDKKTENFQVYVIDKRSQLRLQQNIDLIKKSGFEVEINGNTIFILGKIQNLEQYKIIHQIIKTENIQIKVDLSSGLRNELITMVYENFYAEEVTDVFCHTNEITISCSYYDELSPSLETLRRLKDKYFINFTKLKPKYAKENFQVNLKIIGLERIDGNEINFGLDQMNAEISTLFKNGLQTFIETNKSFFNAQEINASTLAEPELIVKNNQPALIQVGSEIPYQLNTEEGTQTSWKFAGLKVNFKLTNLGNAFYLNYDTEFTSHEEGPVSGNKESSRLKINLNTPTKLFEVGMSNKGNQIRGIPILKEIPLLGKLFSYSSKNTNFKRIIAYVSIKQLK